MTESNTEGPSWPDHLEQDRDQIQDEAWRLGVCAWCWTELDPDRGYRAKYCGEPHRRAWAKYWREVDKANGGRLVITPTGPKRVPA